MTDVMTESGEVPVIRGMGVYCPLATSCNELESALLEGRDSIRKVKAFDASRLLSDQASAFGAQIDVQLPPAQAAWMDRATLFAIAAYREALAQSGLDLTSVPSERIAVCLGSSHSGLMQTEVVAKRALAEKIDDLDPRVIAATLVSHCTAVIKRMAGAKGRIVTISSACASSNTAVGVAAEMIRTGEADIVIAGGADTVSLSVMAGFNALRALATDKTAPFAQDIGLSIGEGAGILILTRADIASGADSFGQILGYGLSGDAYHATAPDQQGEGAANAVVAALNNAEVAFDEIGYINAHGTGTEANDGAESQAIARLFGKTVPVSSTKSYYGHTLGASGVIETISSILLARRGMAPANLRMDALRSGVSDIHFTKQGDTLPRNVTILVNNFGFGGNNSSILVSLDQKPRPRPSPPEDDIVITGIGVCSAAGEGHERFTAALSRGETLSQLDEEAGVRVAKITPLRFTSPDLRPFARTAPTTKHALSALKEALSGDAALYGNNQRSGLIAGVVFGAQKPIEKFMESVFAGDPSLANAHYFPMITMNATGGACSLAFQIKGYTTTLCGSASALVYAADLARQNRQDRVAVVSGDEMTLLLAQIYNRAGVVEVAKSPRTGRATALAEFGVALTLERYSVARQRGARVVAWLKAWATRQDPVDLSVSKCGDALQRAINVVFAKAATTHHRVSDVIVLDGGLAPIKLAVRRALERVFAGKLPPVTRPQDIFGYAPNAGALMMVAAALTTDRALALACGYDVSGEAFAFLIKRGEQ